MIYLASNSPRRRELLQQIDIPFEQLSVNIDESKRDTERPEHYVVRMAKEKAAAGRALAAAAKPILSADTSVVIDDQCLGKPVDEAHALQMLRQLSGREHQVLSAVAVEHNGEMVCRLSVTDVVFRPLLDEELKSYWRSGEPMDKAGAYAIQGRAAVFVERISGSYSGVVGLPLFETEQLLRQVGVITAEF